MRERHRQKVCAGESECARAIEVCVFVRVRERERGLKLANGHAL